ncbi:hypothetical protein [Kangiella aquimarina]|uniref:Sulfotransferase domain-containing protein n=1 Tax=Kangiella aquimarina TaxID=261965 RepID=A0ABZ0X2H5_9GAMM|nr:hypothetical protein [Kangiella aquimarina]WQG84800.1 hypothetical protein SR900_10040 [Kangiella aquimarina]
MKSGTTYLQSVLHKNKSQLKLKNWRYPGQRLNQQHAIYDLVPDSVPWSVPKSGRKNGELSNDLASQIVKSNDSNVILSAEVLSCLDELGISKVVDTFGQPDKIIFTVRNLSSVIPSAWQQYIKGGGKLSLDKFVNNMENDRDQLSGMWKIYAYGNQIRRWSKVAPISVVIVPTSGVKEDLAHMFLSALELNSEELNLSIKSTESNLSLGYELTEILRFLNARHSLSDKDRNFFLKHIVFPKLGKIKSSKISLSNEQLSLTQKWAQEESATTIKYANQIIGEIEDLNVMIDDNREPHQSDDLFGLVSEILNDLIQYTSDYRP